MPRRLRAGKAGGSGNGERVRWNKFSGTSSVGTSSEVQVVEVVAVGGGRRGRAVSPEVPNNNRVAKYESQQTKEKNGLNLLGRVG